MKVCTLDTPSDRWSSQPLIWTWFFILMQIKLVFTRKVVHLASLWKWGFFGTRKLIKLTIPQYSDHPKGVHACKVNKITKEVHKCVINLELFEGNKAVSPVSCLSFGWTESTVRGNREFKQRHFWATDVNLSLIICLDSTKFVVPTAFIL